MQEDRVYSVYPSDLNILNSFKEFEDYLNTSGFTPIEQKNSGHYLEIHVDSHRWLHAENYSEFIRLLTKHPNSLPISLHYNWNKNDKHSFSTIIEVNKSNLKVCVRSEDLEVISAIHDKIKICFKANNPLNENAEILSKYDLKRTIFLAHRFDDYGNKIATKLNTFLRRLRFDVLEGGGYETKNIPDKVTQKIRSQDIFICVFTPGDYSWILSETAYAKALGKYIVIICENDQNINKGIIGGDYEHLPFPHDEIEKCYSDLLYSLPY
jgi:hypothetical protein